MSPDPTPPEILALLAKPKRTPKEQATIDQYNKQRAEQFAAILKAKGLR